MEPKPEKRRRKIAGWIGIPGISLWGALRVLDWLFSLGGASGNAEGWRKAGAVMLSAMPPWLMPVLFAGSGVALLIYLVGVVPAAYGEVRDRTLSFTATPEGIRMLVLAAQITMVAIPVLLAGAFLYYLVFIYERPKWTWTHPTLSVAEQKKVRAECEMRAYDAIGGGRGGLMDPTPGNRGDYISNCLTAKGFNFEKVDSDG